MFPMNTILKSMIIYSELLLLTISSSVTISITPNYYETKNYNSTPTIERNNFLSDVLSVRNNHQSKGKWDPQTKADHLSFVNCLQGAQRAPFKKNSDSFRFYKFFHLQLAKLLLNFSLRISSRLFSFF